MVEQFIAITAQTAFKGVGKLAAAYFYTP